MSAAPDLLVVTHEVSVVHPDRLVAEALALSLVQHAGVVVLDATDDPAAAVSRAPRAALLIADRRCVPVGLTWHQHGTRPAGRLPLLAVVGDPLDVPAVEQATQALRLGARGWIPYDASPSLLRTVVTTVLHGQLWLPPERIEAIIGRLGRQRDEAGTSLTGRERSVLDLLATGQSTRQIADLLFLSPNTIRTHRQSLFRKLGVHSSLEAAAWARRVRATSAS